jgi:Tol biopolymer transport system component
MQEQDNIPSSTALLVTSPEVVLGSSTPAFLNETTNTPTNLLNSTATPSMPTASPSRTVVPSLYLNNPLALINWDSRNPGVVLVHGDSKNSEIQCLVCDEGTIFSALTWSPDGQWIAFISDLDTQHSVFEIFKVRLDGSEVTRLTYNSLYELDLAWSPDGESILFTATDEDFVDRQLDLYLIGADGSGLRRMTNTGANESSPTWSPDGNKIAFINADQPGETTDESRSYLMIMDPNGDNLQLVSKIGATSGLDWSPDGKRIAFVSESNCGDIYVVNIDGNDALRLTSSPGRERSPTWSADGRYIAFVFSPKSCQDISEGVHGWSLQILDIVSGEVMPFFVDAEPTNPHWSPVTALQIGDEYVITTLGANLNLRDSPSLRGNVLIQLAENSHVTVLEGPLLADHYYWWKLRTEDGTEGWAVEVAGWYQLLTDP